MFIYLFFLKANFKFNNNFYNYNDNIIGTKVQIGCMELTLNFSLKAVLLSLVVHNFTNKTYQKNTIFPYQTGKQLKTIILNTKTV